MTLLVTALSLLVAASCFAVAGEVLAGAMCATRFSARFSALVFALALAARAGRPRFLAARRLEWTLAFTIAHAVHYTTVLVRALVEPDNDLRHPSLDAVLIVTGGFGLIATLAWTVLTDRRRLQAALFYAIGAGLGLVLSPRAADPAAHPASAAAMAVLIAAAFWRIGWGVASRVSPP
ncbi:MAG TPA: hypothetical protein VFR85_03010 [Anaeromyxobacteraceae bacterium]|nr:hypothetical protein [Anaeromyxobacteraceae bacterium]